MGENKFIWWTPSHLRNKIYFFRQKKKIIPFLGKIKETFLNVPLRASVYNSNGTVLTEFVVFLLWRQWSYSPLRWLSSSLVYTGKLKKTWSVAKRKLKSQTTALQQRRREGGLLVWVEKWSDCHLLYKYFICPHLQCPFWRGTSETLQWGIQWSRNPPSYKEHRSFASLLPWQYLPSQPAEVKQREI